MCEQGFFDDGPRYELLDGELIEMSAQGPLHRQLETELLNWVSRRIGEDIKLAVAGPFRLGEFDEPEPDLFLYPAAMNVNDVRGPDADLVIEVANTSLQQDLGPKAGLYQSFGVRRYWVMDVEKRVTWVHQLDGARYGAPRGVAFAEPLQVPGVAEPLVVADLIS